MTVSHKRYVAALTFLMLMAVNFAAEGYSLYVVHSARFLAAGTIAACCPPPVSQVQPAEAQKPGSCCSSKKKKLTKPKACGCPHCGDSCPMGDACTCNPDGKQKSARSEGLFFRLPGCHPEQDNLGTHYLPLSMRLVFVRSEVERPAEMLHPHLPPNEPALMAPGNLPAPPVPPPQSAAA